MSLLTVKDCFCYSGFDGQVGQTAGSGMSLPLDCGRFKALCNPTITLQFPLCMANLGLKTDGPKFLSLSDDVWGCAACVLFSLLRIEGLCFIMVQNSQRLSVRSNLNAADKQM